MAVVAVPNSNAAVLSLQRTDSETAGEGIAWRQLLSDRSLKGGCPAESSHAVRPEKEGARF